MARVSIFLITVTLVTGVVGCVQPASFYDLTIASTAGGSVTIPVEGTSTYDEGTVVNLVATPDPGYLFVDWTGDVSTIADVNAASTTIIVNEDYSIEADFAAIPPVQHNLTICSTNGGSIASPGEGTFTYDAGTVVDLVAQAEEGYQFVAWTGDVSTIENVDAADTTITMNDNYLITANFDRKPVPMVVGGAWHTLGLKSDGTVVAVGYDSYGQCNVGNWTDIIQVVAGRQHTAGLKSDGTVVAVGLNAYTQCNVGEWTDIIQVAAGANSWHTVGLKADGTVVATGGNWDKECDVADWTGIIQVAAGGHHTVGLKSDGTVVALGRNNYGECDASGWTDVVQIAGGCQLTIALKSDGTVVTAGWNDYGQRSAGGWAGIIQVAAGMTHTIGLRSDGGVIATGGNGSGQCNVSDWTLT